MGAETKIEWCDHTFNAWIGCHKVSPGCKHCYAEHETFTRVSRARGLELWGANAARHVTSDANWKLPLRWNREWAGRERRGRVFCSSLSDVFEDRRDLDPVRTRLWALVEECYKLEWLLLTKRPEHVLELVPESWARHGFPEHVRVGTTVEDQEHAEVRIPHLLKIPAANFLSCEPLLSPLDLRKYFAQRRCARCRDLLDSDQTRCDDECATGASAHFVCGGQPRPALEWAIVGGESGAGARPMQLWWASDVVKQCRKAGTACFVKQFGAKPRDPDGLQSPEIASRKDGSYVLRDRKGGDLSEIPGDWPREFPR